MRLGLRSICLGLALSTAATCSTQDSSSSEGHRISVVASFYPLAYAAQRLGGDAVEVTNLTPPGVEPHDLELTPDDLEAIANADVVLFLGGGFQPAVEDAVSSEATGSVVDLMQGVQLLPAPEGEEFAADPHIWLDPSIFARVVDRVAAALTGAGAAGVRSDALTAELERIDRAYADGLHDCESRILVTNHAAFGYLAAAYGLTQVPITGLSPETEPDPKHLAELASMVRSQGVSTIFSESLLPPDYAEVLARETGARTAELNPLEGLTPAQLAAGEDFVSVMRANLATIRAGLRC